MSDEEDDEYRKEAQQLKVELDGFYRIVYVALGCAAIHDWWVQHLGVFAVTLVFSVFASMIETWSLLRQDRRARARMAERLSHRSLP